MGDSMSNAVLKGNASGTGTVTLETPNTNSDFTISLPAAAGTMMVSGNMPAFSAYPSTTQSIATSTNTKVIYGSEFFDTNNCFDSTTNYRFTPTVAGYYQITAAVRDATGPVSGQLVSYIYKNGSVINFVVNTFAGAVGTSSVCSVLLYLNGTTDYIEHYVSQNSVSSVNISASSASTYFQATLVRAA
jgi:hypothetical protein